MIKVIEYKRIRYNVYICTYSIVIAHKYNIDDYIAN